MKWYKVFHFEDGKWWLQTVIEAPHKEHAFYLAARRYGENVVVGEEVENPDA